MLCYGIGPDTTELAGLAANAQRRQSENTQAVYDALLAQGMPAAGTDALTAILESPSSQQLNGLFALLEAQSFGADEAARWDLIKGAGFAWATNDIGAVVEAAHGSGAVCIIAHPGRGGGWTNYDERLLDELRQTVPIDGIEVYYPAHTPEQIAMYLEYARKHQLLTSSGSDSHGPEKQPIKYRAEWSRNLLERMGILVR